MKNEFAKSLLLLLSMTMTVVDEAMGSLCYDGGASEYEILYGTAFGRRRLLSLSASTGYGGESEIEGLSPGECQTVCHKDLACAALEYSQYDYVTDEVLQVPICRFYSSVPWNQEMTDLPGNTAFVKQIDGIVYEYCGSVGEVCSCATTIRAGSGTEWVFATPSGVSDVMCEAASFGLMSFPPGFECQCSTHDGMLLYLDASNYISGDIWEDQSSNGHHAYLSHAPEKLDSSAPTYVPASSESPAHFSFDGTKDWLAVKDLRFLEDQRVQELTAIITFKTNYGGKAASSNYALIDFDRTQFFNIYVRGDNGKLGFSTSGGGTTHDMVSSFPLNDGEWYTIMCTYSSADNEKVIYVSGDEDSRVDVIHDGGLGSSNMRYGMIGEGSQSSTQFGSGTGEYFEGGISSIELYTSLLTMAPYEVERYPISQQSQCDSLPQCMWTSIRDPNSFANADTIPVSVGDVGTMLFPNGISGDRESYLTITLEDTDYENDFFDVLYLPDGARWDYTGSGIIIADVDSMDEWDFIASSIIFYSQSTILTPRYLSYNFGATFYSSGTGNYYRFFDQGEPITWQEARTACNEKLFSGQSGYLVTITSEEENDDIIDFVDELEPGLSGPAWIGLSDENDEGTWRWVTGPEGEENGSLGKLLGKVLDGEFVMAEEAEFASWASSEPNSQGDENYAEFYETGEWNDLTFNDASVTRYMCEWDGLSVRSNSITIELSACVLRPCNHAKESHCVREKACSWSAERQECYPTCEPNYYTDNCNVYCLAEDTCSNHGRCGATGLCVCDSDWGGPRCSWPRHQCTAWGDPHYTSFSGDKFDFHGFSQPTTVYSNGEFHVAAKHYRCGGTELEPIACMKQIQISSSSDSIEINIDIGQNPSEYGRMYLNGIGTQISSLKLPVTFSDISLINFHVGSSTRFSYTFEAQTGNSTHTRVKVTQDSSWKAPYLNVYVEHFGSTSQTKGLCSASACNNQSPSSFGKDCTDEFASTYNCDAASCSFATNVEDSSIPFCGGTCSIDSLPCTGLSLSWATDCCANYKTCAGQELYEQCIFENCNMGWGGTTCVQGFEDVLLELNLCAEEICQASNPNREGPSCERCRENYFGPNCEFYCDPEVTCSGRGICNSQGKCWCEEGFTYSNPLNNKHCLSICEMQTTQASCKSRDLCRWSAETGTCLTACERGLFGPTCQVECNPYDTCSGHGSCAADGSCNCEKNWGGSECAIGKFTCSAWGDPHYTTFTGERYDFFGPPGDGHYDLYSFDRLHVSAKHWRCNNRATCMKRVSIWDERGGAVEVLLDGQIKINCTTYTPSELSGLLEYGPWEIMSGVCPDGADCEDGLPVRLVAVKNTNLGHGNALTYYFEIGMIDDKILEVQLAARYNAVDAYLTHYGDDPLSGDVAGLCLAKPGSGAPGTGDYDCFSDDKPSGCPGEWCRTGPAPCAVLNTGCLPGAMDCGFCDQDISDPPTTFWRCSETSSQMKAENCCIKFKSCSDPAAYQQCIWDECALGSDTTCLDNYKAAMDFDDQNMEESCACEKPHQAIDYETGECTKCKVNWYSTESGSCSKFCSASITCNNNGECDANGLCWCDEGFAGDNCLLPAEDEVQSAACKDQNSEVDCAEYDACEWDDGTLECIRSSEMECWEYVNIDSCNSDGCYWQVNEDSYWDMCIESRPPPKNTPSACTGSECPTTFVPSTAYVISNDDDCIIEDEDCPPAKVGEPGMFFIDGYPSRKVFPQDCKQWVSDFIMGDSQVDISSCMDGWVAVIKQDQSCNELSPDEVLAETADVIFHAPVYMIEDSARTTVPFIYSDDIELVPWFTVCYIPPLEFAEKPPTAIPRECTSNFESDNNGNCRVCSENWYGFNCDIWCHAILTCNGHGTCKSAATDEENACACTPGWVDLQGEVEGTQYNLECFSPDPSHHTVPAPYEPPVYVPKYADLICSDVDCALGVIQITGVPPKEFVNTCNPSCSVDGTALIIKLAGSCSNPDDQDILVNSTPISHTSDPEIRSSSNITIPFNASQIDFQVCYRPQTSPAPKSVLMPVSAKLRMKVVLSEDSSDSGFNEIITESDSSLDILLIVSVVMGGLVLTVLGIVFLRRSRGNDTDSLANDIYLAGNFSDSKLEELAPVDPDADSELLDDFDFDGIEP